MDKYDFIRKLDDALSPLSEPERESALKYYKELFDDAGSEKEAELIERLGSPEKVAESIIKESGMLYKTQNDDKSENQRKSHKDKLYDILSDKTMLIIIGVFAFLIITSLEDFIIPLSIIAAICLIVFTLISKNNNKNQNINQDSNSTVEYSEQNENISGLNEQKKTENSRDGKSIALIILIIILTFPIWITILAVLFSLIVAAIAVLLALLAAFSIAGVIMFTTGISIVFNTFGVGILLIGLGLVFIGLLIITVVPLCKITFRFCKWLINLFVSVVRSVFYKREVV